jgi:IS5 family transposase
VAKAGQRIDATLSTGSGQASLKPRASGKKHPINADAATKLIQVYAVTPAHVHDSQVVDDRLDTATRTAADRKRPVYANRPYRSAEREAHLADSSLLGVPFNCE